MAQKIGNGLDLNSQKIINQADPTNPQDSATKAYVDNVARGLDWHNHVRVLVGTNVTISSPGATLDGISMAANDRILLTSQSTGSQNGLWVWNASASALTRPTDYAAAAVLTKGSVTVTVTEGTNADKIWTLTTDGTVTVDTTTTAWAIVGGGTSYSADGNGIELSSTTFSLELDGATLSKSATGLKVAAAFAGNGLQIVSDVASIKLDATAYNSASGLSTSSSGAKIDTSIVPVKYTTLLGAVTGATPVTITHSIGNKSVICQVYIESTGEQILTDVILVNTTSLTLTFATSQSANFYRVVVVG